MPPPKNSKPVWFTPRNGSDDRICHYVKDGLQAGHFAIEPLTLHPRAAYDDEFKGLVFLYREPVGDNGNTVRDWYGPLSLVDDLLSVTEAGTGYSSSLLYARGTAPPVLDTRIGLTDEMTMSGTFSADWAKKPPLFVEAGYDFLELEETGTAVFTGNEVYLKLVDVGNLGISAGIYQISRHIDTKTIHIVVPYDSTMVFTGNIAGSAYDACYILDGYSDTESAPGVLSDKFHVRRFNYRLASPSSSNSWDESLGIELTQETRIVPRTWATSWLENFPSASTSSETSAVSYQSVSKTLASRQTSGISGDPQEDGLTWASLLRIQVPTILRSFCMPFVWAEATSGAYKSYDEDWGIAADTWGPGSVSCSTRTVRRIVVTSDINATISSASIGGLFSFQPKSYSIKIGSWMAWAGDNVWTRARIRPTTIGPYLLQGGKQSALMPVPKFHQGGTGTGVNIDEQGKNVDLIDLSSPPWGTEVLWDVRQTKARWGYWSIDFVYLTLPADPSLTATT